MTTLQEQAQKALPIIQAIIEKNPRVRVDGHDPAWGFRANSLTAFISRWSIAAVEFPTLPEGEEWHNPQNRTAEQIGCDKGWRPLLKSETIIPDDAEFFEVCSNRWIQSHCRGKGVKASGNLNETYRTKNPIPETAVEMTVAEIEKILGKRVKIVKE